MGITLSESSRSISAENSKYLLLALKHLDLFWFDCFRTVPGSAIDFRLIVCDIANVTHAHIHVGAAGTNGPGGNNIVVPFFDQPSNPVLSTHGCTVLAHGVRGPNDLIVRPSAGINSWADFVHALMSGNTYVNVHTIANPAGEIRGQLVNAQTDHHGEGEE